MANLTQNHDKFVYGNKIDTDYNLQYAASAAALTRKNIDITKPSDFPYVMSNNATIQLKLQNTSRVSDMTVEVMNLETSFDGETRQVLLTSLSAPLATAAVIENCEDAWDSRQGANVTCGTDGSIKVVGTNSAKMQVGSGASTGLIASETISSTNCSNYTHIELWVYSSIALNANDLYVCVDDTADCASPLETLYLPAISATTWTKCIVPLANPTLDLAIVSVGVGMAVDKGAFDLYLDDVNVVKQNSVDYRISGVFNGGNLRLGITNDTVLGANDACEVNVRLRVG